MAEIFVDTVAWLALINTSDALHDPALQTLQQLRSQRAQLTTTEFILIEVADALCAPNVRDRTVHFVDGLRRLPMLTIISVSNELLGAGWNLYRQRSDKSWGLTLYQLCRHAGEAIDASVHVRSALCTSWIRQVDAPRIAQSSRQLTAKDNQPS